MTFDSIAEARRVLSDSDPTRRVVALTYLAGHQYPDRTADMIAALDDPEQTVVQTAIHGLIGQSDDWALAGLVTVLESDSSILVQSAALALGEHGDSRAMPHLLSALSHADWQVRLCAIYGLARLGGPQVLLALHASLTDRHRDVRFTAASFLSALELRSHPNG